MNPVEEVRRAQAEGIAHPESGSLIRRVAEREGCEPAEVAAEFQAACDRRELLTRSFDNGWFWTFELPQPTEETA